MSVVIASGILLIFASTYAVVLKRKLAETVILSAASIILVLYLFGFLNQQGCLLWGIYAIVALAVVCTGYLIKEFMKHKFSMLRSIEFVEGLLLYGLFLIIALYLNYGIHVHYGDEITFWGTSVRHMYFLDALTTFQSPAGFILIPDYIPGTSLLNYFFTRFSTDFSEWPSYVALNMLHFSAIMPLVKDVFKKGKRLPCIVFTIIVLFIPFTAQLEFSPYIALSVDFLIGCLFGLTLLYYFEFEFEHSSYGILLVSAGCFLLTITKAMGFVFALAIVIIISIDVVFFKGRTIFKGLDFKQKIKKMMCMLSPVLLAFLTYGSWSIHTQKVDVPIVLEGPSLSRLFSIFTLNISTDEWTTIKTFVKAMFKVIRPFTFSMVQCAIAFIIIMLVLCLATKQNIERKRKILFTFAVIVGAVFYETMLMITYITTYPAAGFGGLPSYERYTGSCIIGMMCCVMIHFLPSKMDFSFSKLQSIIMKFKFDDTVKYKEALKATKLLCIGLVAVVFVISNWEQVKFVNSYWWQARATYAERYRPRNIEVAEKWVQIILSNSTKDVPEVLIISQQPRGWWDASRINYLFFYPQIKAGNIKGKYIFGTKEHESLNSYKRQLVITTQDWKNAVLGASYEFLYMFKTDETFDRDYGKFFPDGVQSNMLYRVERYENDILFFPVTE